MGRLALTVGIFLVFASSLVVSSGVVNIERERGYNGQIDRDVTRTSEIRHPTLRTRTDHQRWYRLFADGLRRGSRSSTVSNQTLSRTRGGPVDADTAYMFLLKASRLVPKVTATPAKADSGDVLPTTTNTTAPVQAPQPTQAPAQDQDLSSTQKLICSYNWDCGTAIRVFTCESNLRPDAVSPWGDYGISQINASVWAQWLNQPKHGGFDFWNQWAIPEKNIAMAYAIWDNSDGFWPWACY